MAPKDFSIQLFIHLTDFSQASALLSTGPGMGGDANG